MAKVAMPDFLTSNSHPFGRDTSSIQSAHAMKRKTPSELRGEQLKRNNGFKPTEESAANLLGSEKNKEGMFRPIKKLEPPTKSRYIDTRLDEVYPVKKSSNMFRVLSEKFKDGFSSEQTNSLKNPSAICSLAAKSQLSCPDGSTPLSAFGSAKDSTMQSCQTTEKCSQKTQNMFRTVTELSLGNEKPSGQLTLDMTTLLKGLGAREQPSVISHSHADFSEGRRDIPSVYSGKFSPDFQVAGSKTPLDLTLKTTMRLVSSSSVGWCHRLTTSSTFYGMPKSVCSASQNTSHSRAFPSTAEELFSRALHSWVFPQSSLPASVISALNSVKGDNDFLLKRQLAWEDSFRNLYYLLRKSTCDIFYVCTSQFVVMFTGGYCQRKTKRSCNAYVSQSTRGLRSLLIEQDICFSMPLCQSEVEQASAEDLVELSEIGKHNLGQTRRVSSMSDVDNSPQSLLAFSGSENVHGLYDFLLNYRSFLTSLNGVDVPVLYSPVLFENASLSAPEVTCKEMKKVEAVTVRGSHLEGISNGESSSAICYSIDIRGSVLPPWTISGVCAAMGFEGKSFDASFTNDPISVGLNVALVETESQKSDPQTEKSSAETSRLFGISEAVISPFLQSGSLRGLKYSNDSYIASLSPV